MTAGLATRGPRVHRLSGALRPARQGGGTRAKWLLSLPLAYHIDRSFADFHGPADLADLDERSRVTAEQEADLFRRMNYHKFRADVLRRSLSPDDASARLMEDIEQHLAAAMEIRDCLVRVFLKLAVSILRPFLSQRHGFEELLSEAALALLRAVEMFDPRRGYRFSTYATTAIRRALQRYVVNQHKDSRKLVPLGQLDTLPHEERQNRREQRQLATAVETLEGMLGRLDDREESIVRARFGFGNDCQTHTLQQVADRFGVSRERIRQLEGRALEKLRAMPEAAELDVSP